jgi:UDP-N-acetyl-D-mannosaminuronate dehydrogenase
MEKSAIIGLGCIGLPLSLQFARNFTAHSMLNHQQLMDWAECILDTRNVLAHGLADAADQRIWRA